jgi:hypothetical protein
MTINHIVSANNELRGEIDIDFSPPNPRKEFEHIDTIVYSANRVQWRQGSNGFGDHEVSEETIEEIKNAPKYCWVDTEEGIAYLEIETFKEQFGNDDPTNMKNYLGKNIQLLRQYHSCDTYGFIITDRNEDEVDSCWGFFGISDVTEALKERLEEMKDYVTVPRVSTYKLYQFDNYLFINFEVAKACRAIDKSKSDISTVFFEKQPKRSEFFVSDVEFLAHLLKDLEVENNV